MSRTSLGTILILVAVAVAAWTWFQWMAGEYRVSKCWVADDDVMVVTFRDGLDRSRSISFSNEGRFSTIFTPTGKAAVDWDKIDSIRVARTQTPGLHRLSVRFAGQTSPAELGLIDQTCLSQVRDRYGSALKFVEE